MNTIDQISNYAHETSDKIASATSQAVEALGKRGEKLVDAEQKMVKNCRSFVCDNPFVSLGIAATAGFLLSRLLRSINR